MLWVGFSDGIQARLCFGMLPFLKRKRGRMGMKMEMETEIMCACTVLQV